MAYSLITAAVATGAHRTTILRAIKSGKISARCTGCMGDPALRAAQGLCAAAAAPCRAEPVQTHHPEAEIALLRTMLEEIAGDRRLEDAQDAHWVKRAWKWSRGR
jgi:hypothetical protein